jgi:hypothetical protein
MALARSCSCASQGDTHSGTDPCCSSVAMEAEGVVAAAAVAVVAVAAVVPCG